MRPIGLWSISIILSSPSYPSIELNFPGRSLVLVNNCAKAVFKTAFTKLLFPEPDTPVTQVKRPIGKLTSILLRLLCSAPLTVTQPLSSCRRSLGMSIFSFPDKYFPVKEFGFAMTSFGVPAATTSPPLAPAPGPISIK